MFRRLLYLVVAGCLASCAGGEADRTPTSGLSGDSERSTGSISAEAANGWVTLESIPTSIVSLSPSGTEMLFAIGAGEQVVAVDEYSYYPVDAPVTDLSGYTPNVEAIAGFDPDVVLISDDIGGVVSSLEALEIPVIHLPAARNLDDVFEQIETLGIATGHEKEATELTESMRETVAEAVASVAVLDPKPSFFHELDSTLYTATSQTFIGSVYAILGFENVADAADTDGNGYPQLTTEYLLEADPDFIFLADAQYGVSSESVAERPGWGSLSAVEGGRVVALPADIHSRWGPRIVDFVDFIASEVLVETLVGMD